MPSPLYSSQVFVDLALRVGGFVQRDAHHAVRRGHGLGEQAGLHALDVEVADLAEVEQALVVTRRNFSMLPKIQIVGEMIDEGETEAFGMLVHAWQVFVSAA